MQRLQSRREESASRPGRLAASLLGVLCLLPAIAATDPAQGPESLSTVVRLDASASSPSAEDFDVRVAGESAEVLAAEPLARARDGAPWQVHIYFDTPLLTAEGLDMAVDALGESAEALVALGPVTITVADPEPRDILIAGLHAYRVRETLDLLADQTTLAGELLWRRLRYLNAVEAGEVDDERTRLEMDRERRLLDRQRTALESSVRRRPGDGPFLLILVQDGFDLEFKRFYVSRTEALEDLESDVADSHTALIRSSATAGWTVLPLSLGERGSEFDRPREPLRQLAAATGGDLILSRRQLKRSLAAVAGSVLVTYQAELAGDEPQPLEVRFGERKVRAPAWAGRVAPVAPAEPEQVAAVPGHQSAIRLLSPGPGPHLGRTRLTAITGEHEVAYVAFFLDGFLIDVVQSAPFQTRIDLGPEPTIHTVRAAAYSPGALELGDDTLLLNEDDRPFRVDIVEVVGDPGGGSVELEVAVSTPPGRSLERLDIFWNDELRQSLDGPPFSASIATSRPGPTDHYRVIARLDDGASLETARMATESGISDRLDINLVELYAMVSARGKEAPGRLTRDDFALFHGGETRRIEGFARAEDVPLTLGLAVDTSQSLSYWHDDLREAAAIFFENVLGERDQAFLTDFDVRARLTQGPTRRRELLVGRMAALDFGGYTSLYDAILFSLAQFENHGGRKALVVLTDGDDQGSSFRPLRCIGEAVRMGVPIYMVVVEDPSDPLDDVERLLITQMAEQSGGRIYFFTNRERLETIYEEIVAELHSQYLLTWASDRPLRAADLRDIRVEVRDRKLSVRTVLGSSVRRQ